MPRSSGFSGYTHSIKSCKKISEKLIANSGDPKERFLRNIVKLDIGCWWRRGTNFSSYGNFHLDNRSIMAHRASYLLFRGEIPEGLCVLHTCDNPGCVNPDHLFLGTHKDNTQDMICKGRRGDTSNIGTRNGRAKLSESNIPEVFHLLGLGWTQQRIADKFGVSQMAISYIKTGKNWSHLNPNKE